MEEIWPWKNYLFNITLLLRTAPEFEPTHLCLKCPVRCPTSQCLTGFHIMVLKVWFLDQQYHGHLLEMHIFRPHLSYWINISGAKTQDLFLTSSSGDAYAAKVWKPSLYLFSAAQETKAKMSKQILDSFGGGVRGRRISWWAHCFRNAGIFAAKQNYVHRLLHCRINSLTFKLLINTWLNLFPLTLLP